MFEHYTEKARRAIFFAPYEASQYGSPYIGTEHLLLGLVRDNRQLLNRCITGIGADGIREKVDSRTSKLARTLTSVDLPLSSGAKHVLHYASDEADRLANRNIGTEHLLLGLLREEEGLAAVILRESGTKIEDVRIKIAMSPPEPDEPQAQWHVQPRVSSDVNAVQLHGSHRDAAHLRSMAARHQRQPWLWQQEAWHPRDIVSSIVSGELSFDISLADDSANFKLVKGGWTSDNCVVCGWRLFESEILAHGSGYTNGRDWLCIECYEKLFRDAKPSPTPHPDIT